MKLYLLRDGISGFFVNKAENFDMVALLSGCRCLGAGAALVFLGLGEVLETGGGAAASVAGGAFSSSLAVF